MNQYSVDKNIHNIEVSMKDKDQGRKGGGRYPSPTVDNLTTTLFDFGENFGDRF
jgi:hypothetical protein